MSAGYSKTPLLRKLGIKPGFSILVLNPPDGYFEALGPLPDQIEEAPAGADGIDFIHVFPQWEEELVPHLDGYIHSLSKTGMLWISWPKKSSKMETDLSREVIREIGLNAGLVDIKVCAVDENWSGLKFVYRVKDR